MAQTADVGALAVSRRLPGIEHGSGHVVFVLDKVALG
jgi:hypothetical protein